MKKHLHLFRNALAAVSVLSAAVLIAGCAGADVVLKEAPKSLQSLLQAYPAVLSDTSSTDGYRTVAGDATVELRISDDFSAADRADAQLVTDLKPFTDAGLDATSLPDGWTVNGDRLVISTDFGNGSGAKDSFVSSVFDAVATKRDLLTYHTELDHFGLVLTAGKFEWAKNYATNDKDLVYVLRAQPFVDLGVDVGNVSGWVFKTMKEGGKDVDFLLKPFDLK